MVLVHPAFYMLGETLHTYPVLLPPSPSFSPPPAFSPSFQSGLTSATNEELRKLKEERGEAGAGIEQGSQTQDKSLTWHVDTQVRTGRTGAMKIDA